MTPSPELQGKAVWLSDHGVVENVGSVGKYDGSANDLLISLIAPPDLEGFENGNAFVLNYEDYH